MRTVQWVALVAAAFAISLSFHVTTAAPLRERERPPVNKRAADWTDEERVAARYDAVAIAERNEVYRLDHPESNERIASASSFRSPSGHMAVMIDGRRNPELVLPVELFEGLVGAVDPRRDLRLQFRAKYTPRLRDLGLNPERVWTDLAETAGSYAAYRLTGPKDLCEARKEALRMTEMKIGHDVLYRIFYDVLVKEYTAVQSTNYPRPGELLLKESTCQ